MRRKGRKRGKEGRREERERGGEKSKGEDGAYNTSSKGSKGVVAEYCAVNPGPGAQERGQ